MSSSVSSLGHLTNSMQNEDVKKAYLKLQLESGIKTGDTVMVMCESLSEFCGWSGRWAADMTQSVGKSFKVASLRDTGILLDNGFYYPVFVLKVVEKAYVEPRFKLSADYTAIVRRNGAVAVGCQTIPYDLLCKIFQAASEAPNSKLPEGYIPVRYDKSIIKAKLDAYLSHGWKMRAKGDLIKIGDQCLGPGGSIADTMQNGKRVGDDSSDFVYLYK